jgi:hypothetical protein
LQILHSEDLKLRQFWNCRQLIGARRLYHA